MVELSVIRDLVTIFGVIAGFSYYVLTVRNNQKNQNLALESRKLSIYTSLRNITTNYDWMRRYVNVMYDQQWENVDEYYQKYGPTVNPDEYTDFGFLFATFQMAGMLLKEQAVTIDILYDDMGYAVINLCEKYKPIVIRVRERAGRVWPQIEYLYDSCVEYRDQHPELTF
jgi:hypothetical protein